MTDESYSVAKFRIKQLVTLVSFPARGSLLEAMLLYHHIC